MNKIISRELFKSLILRYQSEIQEGRSILQIYLMNPVGIGEHPQHLDEMDSQLNKISEANDKLEELMTNHYDEYHELISTKNK